MSIITETIDLLKSNPFYGYGKNIEIAKGKNAIPKTWKEAREQIKRYRYALNIK